MLIILYIAKLFSFVFFPGRLDIKVRLVDFVKLTYDGLKFRIGTAPKVR